MAQPKSMGVEEARKLFPRLIESARQGKSTVITRHGKPSAVVVPIDAAAARNRSGGGILSLRGSGRGLYGDAARTIEKMRREWA